MRTQFHTVIDVVPTILEGANIPAPKEVKGIAQNPMEGVSMLYSFDNGKAKDQRTTQYFEMFTNQDFYEKGWMAVSILTIGFFKNSDRVLWGWDWRLRSISLRLEL